MARKKSAFPPAIRVRENQRRSRARKKELIEELQQRLQEYEKRGVQATALVQLAARKVVWENGQLKELLAKKGVSEEEVDAFLQSRERSRKEPTCTTSGVTGASTQDRTRRQSGQMRNVEISHSGNRDGHDVVQSSGLPQIDRLNTVATDSLPVLRSSAMLLSKPTPKNRTSVHSSLLPLIRPVSNPATVSDTAQYECSWNGTDDTPILGDDPQNLLPPVSDCYCPTSPPQISSYEDMMLEMSCEAAASIIAGMRGNGDEEQARTELGCSTGMQCNVKNIKVFQVMGMH